MAFAWSHTTYAAWHGMIFNFEWKRDLDYFLAHAEDAKRISAFKAYSEDVDFIKVEASCRTNCDRKRRIHEWYLNTKSCNGK